MVKGKTKNLWGFPPNGLNNVRCKLKGVFLWQTEQDQYALSSASPNRKRNSYNTRWQLGTHNMGAYLRKMAIDGYIIKVDYTEQKKLAAAVSRVAGNINHICRRINSTGLFYEDDIVELKAKQCEIWELLKQSQRAEL